MIIWQQQRFSFIFRDNYDLPTHFYVAAAQVNCDHVLICSVCYGNSEESPQKIRNIEINSEKPHFSFWRKMAPLLYIVTDFQRMIPDKDWGHYICFLHFRTTQDVPLGLLSVYWIEHVIGRLWIKFIIQTMIIYTDVLCRMPAKLLKSYLWQQLVYNFSAMMR